MPEPLKNLFNPQIIALMAQHLKRAWDGFDEAGFVHDAGANLAALELKERSHQIKAALERYLPDSFAETAPILLASLHPEDDVDLSGTGMDDRGIRGWAIMPMTDYVGQHGTDDFDLGMDVQRELTKRFSAEFGIRYFILKDQNRALGIMDGWASDPNYHVRRLVSEGARPRLPWAMQLPELICDPAPLLPILTKLRDDPAEYVRRSVANNLNDIAKDHPDMVADIAGHWLPDAPEARRKLVRHACRTLIKQGHAKTLAALGYGTPQVSLAGLEVATPTVTLGGKLQFALSLKSEASSDQDLILDYIVHHRKANGQTSPKVFKWKTFRLAADENLTLQRSHPIRPITTRVYYAGTHLLEVQVNGQRLGGAEFELLLPDG